MTDHQCEKPKTQLKMILDFLRDVLKYLDNNKAEALIFFFGISFALVAWAMGKNADNLNKIVDLFR